MNLLEAVKAGPEIIMIDKEKTLFKMEDGVMFFKNSSIDMDEWDRVVVTISIINRTFELVEGKQLKTHWVTIDENNKKIKFEDGREFKLEPIEAKPEEKKTLSDKLLTYNEEHRYSEEDVKEAIKEFIKRCQYDGKIKVFGLEEVAKEIFGERLVEDK